MSAAVPPGVAELFAAAVTNHQAGRLAEAEHHYRQILAAVPDHADALHLLGVIAYQLGRPETALELIDQAIRHNGNNSQYYCNRGLALEGLQRLDEAVASYDRALTIVPKNPEAWNNRALALHGLMRFEEALASYDRALAVRPDFVEALNNRGNAQRALTRFEEALASYGRALAVRPDLAETHFNRGNILDELKRFEEALESYDRALAVRPDYADVHYSRGNTLQQLDRFSEALESYDRAVAVKPDNADAWNNRGNASQQLGRLAEAVESYDRALAIRPDDAEVRANRSNAVTREHTVSMQYQIRSEILALKREISRQCPDNPVLSGFKVYCQVDEDGIVQELLRRVPSERLGRTLIEIGCGDGLENNTHYLMLKGYRGFWVDGSAADISFLSKGLGLIDGMRSRLKAIHRFIDAGNIADTIAEACSFIGSREPDLLSIDIDGNDLFVLQGALTVCRPKFLCVEYNAKFPPPVALTMRYNAIHRWAGDDYQGASLQMFCVSLVDYTLVTCNLSGANAFFARNDLMKHFTRYTIDELYQPLRADLRFLAAGHPPSLKWLSDALTDAPGTKPAASPRSTAASGATAAG